MEKFLFFDTKLRDYPLISIFRDMLWTTGQVWYN